MAAPAGYAFKNQATDPRNPGDNPGPSRNLIFPRHDDHPPNRPDRIHCRRAAIHQLLPLPADYIQHLARAYEREQSPAAKDAMAQILTNSKMSATGHRPICQDTGIVNVFLKIGMDVRWEGFTGNPTTPSTKACAVATTTKATRCAPAWWPTCCSPARTPGTTPRR